jgi:hypothetical protein
VADAELELDALKVAACNLLAKLLTDRGPFRYMSKGLQDSHG